MNDFVSNSMDSTMTDSRRGAPIARPLPLPLHFAIHGASLLIVWSLLAAADSWTVISGLGIAKLLAIITGALAGGLFVAAMHEWGHLLGARMSKADITISSKRTALFSISRFGLLQPPLQTTLPSSGKRKLLHLYA